nr:MAG TPA: hypothetical protein [Caudoviricetes sp.]
MLLVGTYSVSIPWAFVNIEIHILIFTLLQYGIGHTLRQNKSPPLREP